MQVDRNEMQLMAVFLDSGIKRQRGTRIGDRERCDLSLTIMDRTGDAMLNPELAGFPTATLASWLALYRIDRSTTRREASLRSSARSLDRSCHTDSRSTAPPRNSDTSSLPACRRHRLVVRSSNRQNTENRIDPKFVATNPQCQTCCRAAKDFERIVQIFYSFARPCPIAPKQSIIHDRFSAPDNISDLCRDTVVPTIAE
jgi:hypothetical protein